MRDYFYRPIDEDVVFFMRGTCVDLLPCHVPFSRGDLFLWGCFYPIDHGARLLTSFLSARAEEQPWVPSGNQTWHWTIPYKLNFLHLLGKSLINGPFSIKPCLVPRSITGGCTPMLMLPVASQKNMRECPQWSAGWEDTKRLSMQHLQSYLWYLQLRHGLDIDIYCNLGDGSCNIPLVTLSWAPILSSDQK